MPSKNYQRCPQQQLFLKIANHTMKVVSVDAAYTDPYVTDVVVVAPGHTTDVLLTADQPPSLYYMASHPYFTAVIPPIYDKTTTTGIISYQRATSSKPIMPVLPAFNDTDTAHNFFSNITSLVNGTFWLPQPLEVDYKLFVTIGLGLVPCESNASSAGPKGQRFAASMNNESFQFPTKMSMLEAFYNKMLMKFTQLIYISLVNHHSYLITQMQTALITWIF